MKLELIRTYHPEGTNGMLYIEGKRLCYTIELPYKDNKPTVSCIPEGTYELKKRYSPRFKHHLLITGVVGRSLILIHPANNAATELKGCIAPVTKLTAAGKGNSSRAAFQKLLDRVYPSIIKEKVFLTIKSINHDADKKDAGSYTSLLQKAEEL